MKWKVRKPGSRMRALRRWHKWFAWYPVRVPTYGRKSEMTMIWLEYVNRKGRYYIDLEGNYWTWKYQ